MNEPTEPQTDLRSEPERFEDALRKMFTTPKKDVQANIDAAREQRKQQTADKQK